MGETTNEEASGAIDAGGSNKGSTPVPTPVPGVVPQAPVFAPEEVKIERLDLTKPREAIGMPAQEKVTPIAQPAESAAATFKREQDDISRILGAVKLPENPTTPEVPAKRTYDTSLTADAEKVAAERAQKQEQVREAASAVRESLPSKTPNTADDVRPLHTLKDDLQDVVRNKKISLVRAVALEEEKRHRPRISPEEESPPPRRNMTPIILTLALFLFGAGALGGTYYILSDRVLPTNPIDESRLLFAEQTIPFPIGNLAPGDVRREIALARSGGTLALGAILNILPTAETPGDDSESLTPLSFGEFMRRIDARPPEELLRALSNEFFFGIHTVDENAPLLVIPVTSYERAFAGMLIWEKTLNTDLTPMFTAVSAQTAAPDGTLIERAFEDAVIRNYDVRVLKDEGGTVQLYYSFPTRNILIIAESQYSFAELLSRLRADRRL